jgi:hypothetical protein
MTIPAHMPLTSSPAEVEDEPADSVSAPKLFGDTSRSTAMRHSYAFQRRSAG